MSGWSAKRWLRAFRATGGVVWRHGRGYGIGWQVKGRSEAEQDAARQMYGDMFEHPLRHIALRLQLTWSE
jgi:hypothetical protein